MRNIIALVATASMLSSCSTLDQSLKLGSMTGSLAGAVATYSGEQAAGRTSTLESVGLGASIGMAVGLITSYFIHDSVTRDRESYERKTEVYFGDLPPSPFIIPTNTRKGKR